MFDTVRQPRKPRISPTPIPTSVGTIQLFLRAGASIVGSGMKADMAELIAGSGGLR